MSNYNDYNNDNDIGERIGEHLANMVRGIGGYMAREYRAFNLALSKTRDNRRYLIDVKNYKELQKSVYEDTEKTLTKAVNDTLKDLIRDLEK